MRRTCTCLTAVATAAWLAVPLASAGAAPHPAAAVVKKTFQSTGAEQTYTVPARVHSVEVTAIGGKGGEGDTAGAPPAPSVGGFGATVTADLAVHPGETLYVEVAGNGSTNGAGGFNGGALGGYGENLGAGSGGGASDVQSAPISSEMGVGPRLVIAAGGGGGGGTSSIDPAGAGGSAGHAGGNGDNGAMGGGAGTATGVGSPNGSPGSGGAGGSLGDSGGGGGGGGLFGGGGGAAGEAGGGGGGGSSGFGPHTSHTSVSADHAGVPEITISYVLVPGTTIRRATINTGKRRATFAFKANLKGATFQCALSKGKANPRYHSCHSPKTYKKLRKARYVFRVRAIDAAGPDPTPAHEAFKIG